VKRIREELGEVRAVDLKPKHLTEYQSPGVTRSRRGTINRELALLRRAVRRFLEDQKLPMPGLRRCRERPRGLLHRG